MNHELKDIKMHDTAEKRTEVEAVPSKGPYRPSVHLDIKQLPELEGKKVGDEFHLIQLVKITGVSVRENDKELKTESFDLEVQKVGLHEGKIESDESDKEKKKEKDGEDIFPKNYKNPNKV